MGTLLKDADRDELIWALFGVRVELCETTGNHREELLKKEHELVGELSDLLDPSIHVDLEPVPMRAPSPTIF